MRPPSFKATAAIAVIAAAATHHDRRPPAHCGHDRRCIVKVARWDCRHWRDRHHCRIAYRADHPNTTHTLLGGNAATISTTHALETVPGETETAFDQCVAQIESTGGLYVDNGAGDLGIYQFTTQTYDYALELMTQRGYAVAGWDPDPLTAPAYQQTAVFNFYSAIDPGAWPYSVPACGGA